MGKVVQQKDRKGNKVYPITVAGAIITPDGVPLQNALDKVASHATDIETLKTGKQDKITDLAAIRTNAGKVPGIETTLAGKQDAITDLAQIKTNAQTGAQAAEKVTELERKVDDLEKRPVVDETLTKRVANLEDVNRENKEAFIENMDNLGDVRVKSVDMDELPKVSGYPLFIFGSGAPTVAPDFVPQFYIDTTGHKIYIADGTANASSFRILN